MGEQRIKPSRGNITDILSALDRGVSVVTGNNRLAIHIRQAFDKKAVEAGLDVWSTPDVIPWAAWLARLSEEAALSGLISASTVLLNPSQEACVWEDIIIQNMADQPLQQVSGTARRALEAWRLIHAWHLPLAQGAYQYNEDSACFWRWASTFDALCAEKGWQSAARLADELQSAVTAVPWAAPVQLLLAGFDELTPQQESLFQALGVSGWKVDWITLEGSADHVTRMGCTDVRQEAATMACWVRQRMEANPAATIGVIVPDLSEQRTLVTQALDQVLLPQLAHPDSQSTVRPYNLSLGKPLDAFPAIHTALMVLELLNTSVDLEVAGRLLRSPFLSGWDEEASARALLDGRLRETGELRVSSATLRYHASESGRLYFCPVLAEKLRAWITVARDCTSAVSAGQWSERFDLLLKTIGWPEGRTLSSEEYQAVEAWQALLGAFAALDQVRGAMTAGRATGLLRRLARERLFQPESPWVPVQVLGLLEAAGLEFDHLWVMGLEDGQWPAAARPNPFIPLPLQRQAGLPHASEERELVVSRRITDRLLKSAREIIVSYPQRNGEEALRASPLITHLPASQVDALLTGSTTLLKDRVHQSARLTPLKADSAPPLRVKEVAGGSAVFKLQAACPFRAFAEIRLGARELGKADIGLDAMTRGTLMHSVLEKIWLALDSHEALMQATDLETRVKTVVDEALSEVAPRYPQTFTARFRTLEAQRLTRQVLEWLALEKQRPPFRVLEKEGKHRAAVGDVEVQLTVDRIDKLDDGRLVVIDYKTGEVAPSQWFGERPEEPQLPLYSMAVQGDIAGVLFAQVKAGAMAFSGVAEKEGLAPGVKSYEQLSHTRALASWQAVLQEWRQTMERLAEAFASGEAQVDPKHYPATCTYCDLKPLCRINETKRLEDFSEAEEPP